MVTDKLTADTISLLKECGAGVEMAVKSLDEVLDVVENPELKKLLESSKNDHENIGREIKDILDSYDREPKELSPMAKAMSWTKINVKIAADKNDSTVADIMTDGCAMGIKTLCKYKNEYKNADRQSVETAEKIIKLEEDLVLKLRKYL